MPYSSGYQTQTKCILFSISRYYSLPRVLKYLSFSTPDICYVVQQVCFFIHNPMASHIHALHHTLRHICGTLDYGLHLYPTSTTTLIPLISYTDADWTGCSDTNCYTFGYCVFLGVANVLWCCKCSL